MEKQIRLSGGEAELGKSNGKVSAKNVTARASKEGGEEEVVTLTDTAVSPAKKYEVTVAAPKLYEKVDEDGKTSFYAAKTLNITTITEVDKAGEVILSLMSSDLDKDGIPASLLFTPAWTSSNPKVAAVEPIEEDGSTDCRVTAVAKGSTRITGWVNGKSYSSTVKITDVFGRKTAYGLPKEFGLNPDQDGVLKDNVTVNPGVKTALNYNGKKTGFVPKKAGWTYYDEDGKGISANDAPAYVDDKGKLVAVYTGSVTMCGEYSDNGKTVKAEISVWVVPAPAKRCTYLFSDRSEILKYYKVKNSNAQWITSKADTVALDDKTKGKIKAVKTGHSAVTCSYNGLEYNTTVYVEDTKLDTSDGRISAGTKANTYSLKLKRGTRFVTEAPGVYQTINWKSAKTAVAFVDEYGIIESRAPGKTKVTARINGTTIKIDVVVE